MDDRGYERRADKSAQAVGWLLVVILIAVAAFIWMFAGGQPSAESATPPLPLPEAPPPR